MTELTGARLSDLAVCPRRCALGAMGCEKAPATERQERFRERGRYDQRWVYERFKARYAPKRVVRELVVPWPLGEGHADLWVPSEKLICEVKSTTAPDSLLAAAVKQVRLYLRFYPKAKHGVIFLLNPSTLEEELLPVVLRPEDAEEIDAEVAQVKDAVVTNALGQPSAYGLPPCAFTTPDQCRNSWCAYTDIAWADWQPPATEWVDGDEEFAEMADRMARMVSRRRDAKQAYDDADRDWKELCGQAAELGIAPGRDYVCNGIAIRRSEVAGRVTFSLSRARATGTWTEMDDERFHAFVEVSEPSQRWSVKAERE